MPRLVHPDDRPRIAASLQGPGGPGCAVEYRVRHRDRGYRWLRDEWTLVRDRVGRPLEIAGVLRDLTAQRALEAEVAALSAREAELRATFQLAACGIARVGLDGRFLQVNEALCRMLGYTEGELLEKTFLDVTHEADLAHSRARLLRALCGEARSATFEKRYPHKGGRTVWALVSFATVCGEAGQPLYFVTQIQDITESKAAEEALAEREERLRASHAQLRSLAAHLVRTREEERVRVAREVHDELGQLLTILKVDLALMGGKGDRRSATNAQRLCAMRERVDEALRAVRKVSAELRPPVLDCGGLGEAIAWLVGEFQSHTTTRCELEGDLRSADLDPEQATQVFRILQEALTNVARHARASRVSVRVGRRDGLFRLEVRDDGVGLPEGALCDPRAQGLTGMRERALLAGGALDIEGVPGRGTILSLRIPRGAGSAEPQ